MNFPFLFCFIFALLNAMDIGNKYIAPEIIDDYLSQKSFAESSSENYVILPDSIIKNNNEDALSDFEIISKDEATPSKKKNSRENKIPQSIEMSRIR